MVSVLGVLALLFWLVIRDYAQHPILSQIFCYAILAFIFLIAIMTQFGKARPEEVPQKTVVQVGRVGMFFAKGLSSQEEMMELVRQWNGIEKLPLPNSRIRGSATQEKNYEELSLPEAENFSAEVEKSVKAMIAREAQRISAHLDPALPADPPVPKLGDAGGQKGGAAGVMRSEKPDSNSSVNHKNSTPSKPTTA